MATALSEDVKVTLTVTDGAGNTSTTEVTVTVGTLLGTHPIEIASAPGGPIAARFRLAGGFGYVPIVITGLDRHDGWRLERRVVGAWTDLGQEVEGNDCWQARFDPATQTYELVFNVDNEGSSRYRLVR